LKCATRLVGSTINAKKDPFAPEKTLRSFQHALAELNLSPPAAKVVYAELEAVATVRFPDLLRDLNQVLAAVEPGARQVRARDGNGARGRMLHDDALPDDATRRLIDGLRSQSSSNAAARIPRAVLDVIESLSSTSGGGESVDAGTASEPTGDEATLAELLAAIDRLPMSSGGAFEQASAREVSALLEENDQDAGGPRHIGARHQGVLDTTARLFGTASSDFVPKSDVEALIKRLERTLLKLSLRDGEFPSSPEHPARKVVNLIDQYNFAANDAGQLTDSKLRNNLDGLVTRICEQADQNPAVFSVVQHSLEHDLESLRRERRQRVDRIVEALESRDRVRVIRAQVDQALAGRLAGRQIPRVLIRLLDEVWRQHLVVVGLRHGTESEAWQQALLLIERTLAVSIAEVDDEAAIALRAELNRSLAATLTEAVIDRTLRDRLLLDLRLLMVDAQPDLVSDVVEAPRFAPEAAVKASPNVAPAAAAALTTAGLKVGEWWDMQVEHKWVPVQVIWTSVSTGYSGFVNRSASNRLEMTTADFRRQLASGTVRSRESLDTPLLDRSEAVLLSEAYSASIARNDHDAPTGLLNRKGLLKRLHELESATGGGDHHVVGMLEFDQFRAISSSCGVDAVESLAKTLVERIKKRLPADCVHAMFREDTVAIVMPHLSRTAGLRAMNELLQSVADYHFKFEQHSFSIGVSAGVASFGAGQCGADEVLRRVDAACLAARAIGRNRLQEYEPSNAELRGEEALLAWAGRADALLASDALYLRAQMVTPIGVDTSALPYYEILLGIESTWDSNAQPYDFILALERLGRSHEIDLWVLRQAFQWISDNWMIMDSIAGLAINLSVPSLRHPDVMRFLRQELARSNFPAHKIVFEITETAAIRDFEAAEQFITDIHRYGCGFSLDDFGSGFTSYAHLKRLSIDTMKIDGSYVKDLLTSPSDQAIVKSMTDIGHTLGMKVVAEWVESPQILEKLVEYGVDYAQGYAVHKPVRLSRLVAAASAVAA
jgi:diguanylate cyclase (GGDEF)-like protein